MTTRISHGLWLRRGALPRLPDRVQVLDELPPRALRLEVLEQFPAKARALARVA